MPSSHIPVAESGPYRAREGNSVRPLIGGESAFRRIGKAVEAAKQAVYVTVAFVQPDFRLPDGRGHLFDLLDRAVERGVDVRVLFWRSPELGRRDEEGDFLGTFRGDEGDHELLSERGARFQARWDRLDKTYCHHQKSWVVDPGTEGEVAFVGGINLNNGSVTAHPFPRGSGSPVQLTQDVYCEMAGPVATDAHHNFVQRWNGASEARLALGAWPSPESVAEFGVPG